MPTTFQITIDVHDPIGEARFWAAALGYRPAPPPDGFGTWGEFYRKRGLPEEDCFNEPDAIVDPSGAGPRLWFHEVPENKTCKNRLHFDLAASGGLGVGMPLRRQRVEAEAARLEALGARRLETVESPEQDRYAVAMEDPEGNEFDVY